MRTPEPEWTWSALLPLAVAVAVAVGCPGRKARPADPRPDPEAVLGSVLFEDRTLSVDGSRACVDCHDPKRGYTSGGLAVGRDGRALAFRAPSLWNRGAGKLFFWDGRATSLSAQAQAVLTNPKEMGNRSVADVAGRLDRAGYRRTFEAVYGHGPTAESVVSALVAFERTLTTGRDGWVKYLAGDDAGFSAAALRGAALFTGKARCYTCHAGPELTDERVRSSVLGGRAKTPGLHRCRQTGPYMHNGSVRTLADVLGLYVRGRDGVDDLKPLDLSDRDRDDLLAFLESL